jgi:flagellar biosynthesis chaperone FliJ
VKEYQEMISATISDLQDRLETISDKLDSLPAQNTRSSNEYVNERKRIQEEIESTNQCLIICTEVSKHIGRIRPRNFKNISTASDANYESFITNIGPISANFTTDQTLESCDTTLHSHIQQLQNHLTEMSNRLKKLHSDSDTTSVGQESERQRIQDEFDSTKQSLALCIGASERATKNRLNVYEEVSIEEDGNQYIISTIGDLISAKKISAGARSVQCMGQLSDESFQKMLVHSTARSPVLDGSDTEIASGKGFEHRYGTGFKLEKQKYAVSGAE